MRVVIRSRLALFTDEVRENIYKMLQITCIVMWMIDEMIDEMIHVFFPTLQDSE